VFKYIVSEVFLPIKPAKHFRKVQKQWKNINYKKTVLFGATNLSPPQSIDTQSIDTQSIDTQSIEWPKVSKPRMTNYPKYRKFLNFIIKYREVFPMTGKLILTKFFNWSTDRSIEKFDWSLNLGVIRNFGSFNIDH